MREIALFYNFSEDRLRKAKFALMPLKITVKSVAKEDFNQPVGYLAGIKGSEPAAEKLNSEDFDGEMLVMHNFTSKTMELMLKALVKHGVGRIPIKAVVTPTNKDWDSVTLYKAVAADHEEMTRNKK